MGVSSVNHVRTTHSWRRKNIEEIDVNHVYMFLKTHTTLSHQSVPQRGMLRSIVLQVTIVTLWIVLNLVKSVTIALHLETMRLNHAPSTATQSVARRRVLIVGHSQSLSSQQPNQNQNYAQRKNFNFKVKTLPLDRPMAVWPVKVFFVAIMIILFATLAPSEVL